MVKKFFNIFSKKEKNKIFLLFFLMLFAMMLEVIGIGLIIPAIIILLKGPESLSKIIFFEPLSIYIEKVSNELVMFYGLLFILLIYLIKYLILGFLYFYQYNFTAKVMLRISNSILNNYLKKPYSYFLNTSSSKLINNLIKQVEVVITQGLEPMITIVSETIVLLGILLALIYIDYRSVIFSLLIILLPSSLLYLLIKKKVKKWGNLQQVNDEKVLETLQQTLFGIKEIKIFRREEKFSSSFYNYFSNSVKMRKNLLILNQFPRIWLEVIAIFSICILVVYYFKINKTGEEIITMLAIFGLASIRLLPSLNRIILSSQNFKFSHAAISRVFEELNYNNPLNIDKFSESSNFNNFESIEFKNVDFQYNKNNYLKNINLKIVKGQFIGIKGDTGSGKSTFVDLLCGLLAPTSGEIIFNSKTRITTNSDFWKKKIGYVPQAINLLNDTIEKNITFEDDKFSIKKDLLNKSLLISEILDYVNNLPNGLQTMIGERGIRMSGGQKQRLIIARALYINPEILILDESTNSLDLTKEQKILKNLMSLKDKITIIIISHKKTSLKNCDIVFNIVDHSIKKVKIDDLQ